MTEWSVEFPGGGMDEVHAAEAEVGGGGVLIFRTDGEIVFAYAPGAWKTVCQM